MLSKSDFKIAESCPKKLIYKSKSYDTSDDSNEYLEMLAQGGHVVSKYAQLLYPEGILIKGDNLQDAIEETKIYIENYSDIVLFEATFFSTNKVIRADILHKKENTIRSDRSKIKIL